MRSRDKLTPNPNRPRPSGGPVGPREPISKSPRPRPSGPVGPRQPVGSSPVRPRPSGGPVGPRQPVGRPRPTTPVGPREAPLKPKPSPTPYQSAVRGRAAVVKSTAPRFGSKK